MGAPDGSEVSAYTRAGVDYDQLDAGKRSALDASLATSALLGLRGGEAVDASRGEPAFVFRFADQAFAFVLEGLGTKSMIARAVADEATGLGLNLFGHVAYDTVAAIVNDLCCVGARPLVVNAYFATGSSDWYRDGDRLAELLKGWQQACIDASCTWGGGESPTLPGLLESDHIELAGSAVGVLPAGVAPVLGDGLRAGDDIVMVASNGLHANGSSLARALAADELEDGYGTALPSGRTFGEALLDPSLLYSPLVEAVLDAGVPVSYLSHITGHGFLKLMRPRQEFTYRITELAPEVPEVLEFLVAQAGMDPAGAYSTLNMGCGFAIYCQRGSGADVVRIAEELGHVAWVAGAVEQGPRKVILEPLGVTYGTDQLQLAPSR